MLYFMLCYRCLTKQGVQKLKYNTKKNYILDVKLAENFYVLNFGLQLLVGNADSDRQRKEKHAYVSYLSYLRRDS